MISPRSLSFSRCSVFGLAALLFTTACGEIGLFPKEESDAGAAGDSGEERDSTPIGLGCARDPVSGVELCAALSACPNVVVERDLFPHCGFRPRAGVIDMVCACDGWICSMGMASTCEQAAALLQTQSELGVCLQVHDGRCLDAQPGGGPQPGANDPKCDPVCISECAGNPTCYEFCCS